MGLGVGAGGRPGRVTKDAIDVAPLLIAIDKLAKAIMFENLDAGR